MSGNYLNCELNKKITELTDKKCEMINTTIDFLIDKCKGLSEDKYNNVKYYSQSVFHENEDIDCKILQKEIELYKEYRNHGTWLSYPVYKFEREITELTYRKRENINRVVDCLIDECKGLSEDEYNNVKCYLESVFSENKDIDRKISEKEIELYGEDINRNLQVGDVLYERRGSNFPEIYRIVDIIELKPSLKGFYDIPHNKIILKELHLLCSTNFGQQIEVTTCRDDDRSFSFSDKKKVFSYQVTNYIRMQDSFENFKEIKHVWQAKKLKYILLSEKFK